MQTMIEQSPSNFQDEHKKGELIKNAVAPVIIYLRLGFSNEVNHPTSYWGSSMPFRKPPIRLLPDNNPYRLVVSNIFFNFPFHKKAMSSFPLTFTPSFFKMGTFAPPTS